MCVKQGVSQTSTFRPQTVTNEQVCWPCGRRGKITQTKNNCTDLNYDSCCVLNNNGINIRDWEFEENYTDSVAGKICFWEVNLKCFPICFKPHQTRL